MPTTATRQHPISDGDFSRVQIAYDRFARGEISHDEARAELEAALNSVPRDPFLRRLIYQLFPSLAPQNR